MTAGISFVASPTADSLLSDGSMSGQDILALGLLGQLPSHLLHLVAGEEGEELAVSVAGLARGGDPPGGDLEGGEQG